MYRDKGYFIFKFRPVPLEVISFVVLAVCSFLLIFYNLKWYLPGTGSVKFISEHYLYPVVLSIFIVSFVDFSRGTVLGFLFSLLRTTFAISVIIYCHFNLKLWSALVNQTRWDGFLQYTDEVMSVFVNLFVLVNVAFVPIIQYWPNAYHDVFVMMFAISLIAHACGKNRINDLSQLLTIIALILAMGGIAYLMMPANGPFIFADGTNSWARKIQFEMHGFYTAFTQSNGLIYVTDNFIMALAAMPSLHAAHASALFYFAWIKIRWLGVLYVPVVIFIFSEAIAAKWHYLIDLPIGVLIGFFSIKLSAVLHQKFAAQ